MKKVSKKAFNESFIRWIMNNDGPFSYQNMQAYPFAEAMSPVIKELYADSKEEQVSALKRHSVFYNTQPNWGCIINGIVIGLEEDRANGADIDDETINGLKVGLMGPLAGIGDSMHAGLIVPLLISIGLTLAENGSVAGPLFYTVALLCYGMFLSYFLMKKGYQLGTSAIGYLTGEIAQKLRLCATILGGIVVGGVAAANVTISTPLEFLLKNGETTLSVNAKLNGIFPSFLPLASVLLCWYLMAKKKMSAIKVMLIMVIISVIGVFTGIL